MLMVHVNGKDYEVEQDTKLMRFLPVLQKEATRVSLWRKP